MSTVLLATILTPLAAGLLLLLFRWPAAASRQIALLTTIASLVLSMVLVVQFARLPTPVVNPEKPVNPRVELRYDWMTFNRTVAGQRT
jgi:NADH:ubiquinone oxidoreductase subunit 4 (subunit M)